MFIFSLINILADRQKKKKKRNKHQTSTHVSKNCTFISVISENYNQKSCSLHLRKLQSAKPSSTSVVLSISEDHDRPTPSQGKNHKKEKEKEKKKENEKRGEERNNGGSGT